jgi:hypothetical protein
VLRLILTLPNFYRNLSPYYDIHSSKYLDIHEVKLRSVISTEMIGKGKGKAIPLQAWTGPKGFRSLKLPDFNTVAT